MSTTGPGGKAPSGGAGSGSSKKNGSPSKGSNSKKGTPSNSNQAGNETILLQPPFDSRTLAIPFSMQGGAASTVSQKVMKGYMEWDSAAIPSDYQQSAPASSSKKGTTTTTKGAAGTKTGSKTAAQQGAVVNFQYNPSMVSYTSSNVGIQSAAAAVFSDPADSSSLITAMNQTVSFDLLYNRIYEVQGAYNKNGTPKADAGEMDPYTHGCYVDILAMAQFTGQLANNAGAGTNNKHAAPPKQDKANTQIAFQGPSFLVRSWLILGQNDTALYYGFVSDWSYQVAAWTQNMIPMTCVISVDFTLLPYNPATTDAGALTASGSPWSLVPPGSSTSVSQTNAGGGPTGPTQPIHKAPQPTSPVSGPIQGGNPPKAPPPPVGLPGGPFPHL